MPIIDNEPKGVARTETTSWVDSKIVAADPAAVTITTETFTQVLDPGNSETGVSPIIQVTVKTTVAPK